MCFQRGEICQKLKQESLDIGGFVLVYLKQSSPRYV